MNINYNDDNSRRRLEENIQSRKPQCHVSKTQTIGNGRSQFWLYCKDSIFMLMSYKLLDHLW